MVKSLPVEQKIRKEKTTIFINPVSGNRRGEKLYDAILLELESDPALKERIVSVEKTSNEVDDELYKKTALESDHVIIAGGDGTVHMVINGLLRNAYKSSISVYPVGTANDLAKNLNVGKIDFPSFVRKVISDGYSLKLDVFSINKKVYFTNYAGFGFDAFIVNLNVKILAKLKQSSFGMKLLGLPLLKKSLFVLSGLIAFLSYEKRLVLNPHGKKYLNVIFNSLSTYAGGSIFSENSSFSDGKPERAFLSTKLDFIKLILNRFHLGVMVYDIGAATLKPPFKFSFVESQPVWIPVQLDGEDYTEYFSGMKEFEIVWEGRWDVCS